MKLLTALALLVLPLSLAAQAGGAGEAGASPLATGAARSDQGLDRGLFCAAGSVGATDRTDYAAFLRYAFRGSLTGTYAGPGLGFRCARNGR